VEGETGESARRRAMPSATFSFHMSIAWPCLTPACLPAHPQNVGLVDGGGATRDRARWAEGAYLVGLRRRL